ncbi:MAG: hypothetical protein KJ077_48840 [Anaerolineae bacterium]|nr:hypothetical protein [Anaerolineae bacterium]
MQSTITLSKKSGKGINDGVISELTAFFRVRPGHEEQLREALVRFAEVIRNTDPQETQKTGLRDTRHVLFDNGTRLLWTTTFETDWDPYLDDALIIVGAEHFVDWMQHIVEAEELSKWFVESGGTTTLGKANLANIVDIVNKSSGGLKQIIQSAQTPAVAYWNALAASTIPQLRKAQRVEQAFEQVLDSPEAEQALSHPALQPLLEQAAD